MYLGAHPMDTALPGIFEQACNKAATDAFAPPLRRDEQSDDIHRFAAELRPPFVGSISVPAQCALGFSHDNDAQIGGVHNVLEDTAGIFCGSLSVYVRKQFTGETAKLSHVWRSGKSNFNWTEHHRRNPCCHRHV